jgi:hypothetical protein
MLSMTDKDRNIFKEAAATVLNFTESQLADIGILASELRAIIEAAKLREQEKF